MTWFRKSKPKEPLVLHVEATGREGDRLIVIGRYERELELGHGKRYIQEFGPDGSLILQRRIGNKEAYYKSKKYLFQGVENLGRYLSHIKIYQLSRESLETELGKRVEIVSTGLPNEFLEADDGVLATHYFCLSFDPPYAHVPKDTQLRWLAHNIGANALVLYQAGSPSRATPVKFK